MLTMPPYDQATKRAMLVEQTRVKCVAIGVYSDGVVERALHRYTRSLSTDLAGFLDEEYTRAVVALLGRAEQTAGEVTRDDS